MKKAVNWKDVVIIELLKKDNGICQLCNKVLGDQLVEIDHTRERSDGGIDAIDNLRLVHLTCHKLHHQNFKKLPSITYDTLKNATTDISKQIIVHWLKVCNGNVTRAAKKLGLSRKGLQLKMIKYNLRKANGTH